MEDIKKSLLPYVCPSCRAKVQTTIAAVLQSKKVQCLRCKNIIIFESAETNRFQNSIRYVVSAMRKVDAAEKDLSRATESMEDQFQLLIKKSASKSMDLSKI